MHKAARKPLGVVLDEMEEALNVFIKAEEDRRIQAAVEAKRRPKRRSKRPERPRNWKETNKNQSDWELWDSTWR